MRLKIQDTKPYRHVELPPEEFFEAEDLDLHTIKLVEALELHLVEIQGGAS